MSRRVVMPIHEAMGAVVLSAEHLQASCVVVHLFNEIADYRRVELVAHHCVLAAFVFGLMQQAPKVLSQAEGGIIP